MINNGVERYCMCHPQPNVKLCGKMYRKNVMDSKAATIIFRCLP